MPKRRVQVEDITKPEPVRPTPIQSDTFTVAPRISDPGKNYYALAESLGALSTTLGIYNEKNKQKRSVAEENRTLGLTTKQRAEVARTGRFPDGTSVKHVRSKALVGAAAGEEKDQEIREDLFKEFDWVKGDIDGVIATEKKKWLEENPDADPVTKNSFLRRMEQTLTWARNQKESYTLKKAQTEESDSALTLMEADVHKMIKAGYSPDMIHKEVRNMYKILGKDNTMYINYEDLDAHVVAIASKLAKTNPKVAIELLTAKRGDGPAGAPISKKKKYFGVVESIVNGAKKQIIKSTNQDMISDTHADNFERVIYKKQYGAFEDKTYTDHNGELKTLTKKAQEDRFVYRVGETRDHMIEDKNVSVDEARNWEIGILRSMNLDLPYIKNELNGIEKRVDAASITDPDRMKDITEKVDRYLDLKRKAKNYTLAQVDDKSRQFYESFNMARVFLRKSDEDAAIFAYKVLNPEAGYRTKLTYMRDDIRKAIDVAFDAWGFDPDKTNATAYMAKTQALAEKMIATGVTDVDEAVALAAKYVRETSYVYKGTLLPGLESFKMEQNWANGLDFFISEYKSSDARGKTIKGRIYPETLGSGLILFHDENNQRIYDAQGNMLKTNVNVINRFAREGRRGMSAIERAVQKNKRLHQRKKSIPNNGWGGDNSLLGDIRKRRDMIKRGSKSQDRLPLEK